MTNLILCGGSGSRLWPLSREHLPKQFHPFFGERTLFEETARRNAPLADSVWVAAREPLLALAQQQLGRCGMTAAGLIVEPIGRNTAGPIALVCLALPPDELVLVTPSDHWVTDEAEYHRAIEKGRELAHDDALVVFGIHPTYAETGYGYIEAEGDRALSFHEKPDAATARGFLETGRHLWNSGITMFRAGVLVAELERHAPQLLAACRAVGGVHPTREQMEAIPAVCLESTLLEHSTQLRVVACDPGWSDLGSFDALFDQAPPCMEVKDVLGNTVLGDPGACHPQPVFVDAHHNFVTTSGRQIALVGVEDLVVIDTPDALLIVHHGSGQKVKEVVDRLRQGDGRCLD